MRVAGFLLLFSIGLIPGILHAQENQDMPAPVSEQEEKEENIFSKATPAQIDEAERFYKYCRENPILSAQKNCTCASGMFLDTRMKMGPEASIDEIIAANRNTCLLDPDQSTAGYNEGDPDLSKVTEKQLAEAEDVYNFCTNNPSYNNSYDCDCFAAKFLDQRLKLGPLADRTYIYTLLSSDCRNVVATTGIEYTSCMSQTSLLNTGGYERKKFCECYARRWARDYEAYTGIMNRATTRQIRFTAQSYCRQPEAYK